MILALIKKNGSVEQNTPGIDLPLTGHLIFDTGVSAVQWRMERVFKNSAGIITYKLM